MTGMTYLLASLHLPGSRVYYDTGSELGVAIDLLKAASFFSSFSPKWEVRYVRYVRVREGT